MGTLPYMSPEQLRGDAADARSDVWAWELFSMRWPWVTGHSAACTAFEVSSAILHDAPPALPPHTPEALGRVIQRCLEKQPGRRYQRASEVRAALEVDGPTGPAHWRSAGPSGPRSDVDVRRVGGDHRGGCCGNRVVEPVHPNRGRSPAHTTSLSSPSRCCLWRTGRAIRREEGTPLRAYTRR